MIPPIRIVITLDSDFIQEVLVDAPGQQVNVLVLDEDTDNVCRYYPIQVKEATPATLDEMTERIDKRRAWRAAEVEWQIQAGGHPDEDELETEFNLLALDIWKGITA